MMTLKPDSSATLGNNSELWLRGPKFYGRVFGAQWQIWLWVTMLRC